jgi:hypothetical protein
VVVVLEAAAMGQEMAAAMVTAAAMETATAAATEAEMEAVAGMAAAMAVRVESLSHFALNRTWDENGTFPGGSRR